MLKAADNYVGQAYIRDDYGNTYQVFAYGKANALQVAEAIANALNILDSASGEKFPMSAIPVWGSRDNREATA